MKSTKTKKKKEPGIPIECNLFERIWQLYLSKAFVKSVKMTSTWYLDVNTSSTSFWKIKKIIVDDFPFKKQCWSSFNNDASIKYWIYFFRYNGFK